jgi:hypothetical protein
MVNASTPSTASTTQAGQADKVRNTAALTARARRVIEAGTPSRPCRPEVTGTGQPESRMPAVRADGDVVVR